MKTLLATILLISSTFATDKTAVARALAACGPVKIQYDVTPVENQHPLGQPEDEKALVYVIGDGEFPCIFCSTTSRVGVDGAWVGANDGNSYFYFYVTPGEHHLCTDRQTKSEDADRVAALAPFTAEAGRTYYFRARVTRRRGDSDLRLDLHAINSDEGQLLVAWSNFSNWRIKK